MLALSWALELCYEAMYGSRAEVRVCLTAWLLWMAIEAAFYVVVRTQLHGRISRLGTPAPNPRTPQGWSAKRRPHGFPSNVPCMCPWPVICRAANYSASEHQLMSRNVFRSC
jgi:hypothetical protein